MAQRHNSARRPVNPARHRSSALCLYVLLSRIELGDGSALLNLARQW